MSVVISDADFLSAFLKIERVELIREFFQFETLLVPPAVFREIARTNLLPRLAALEWVHVQTPLDETRFAAEADWQQLGAGEQQAIGLAIECQPSVLLINDNQARRTATRLGVAVLNIPAFLLACKMDGLLNQTAMRELVNALKEKDYYGFRQDVLNLLLS